MGSHARWQAGDEHRLLSVINVGAGIVKYVCEECGATELDIREHALERVTLFGETRRSLFAEAHDRWWTGVGQPA